jgi:galactokinase
MTYEEMQRMMEFILEQQAQLVANGQRTDERINRMGRRVNRIAVMLDTLATTMVERVSSMSEGVDAKFAALADSQMRTEEAVRRLTERGEKTDEAVKNLAEAFDRHLRDHRNGERDVSRE